MCQKVYKVLRETAWPGTFLYKFLRAYRFLPAPGQYASQFYVDAKGYASGSMATLEDVNHDGKPDMVQGCRAAGMIRGSRF